MKQLIKDVRDFFLKRKRSAYIDEIRRLLPSVENLSIISTNCFAGHLYQDFELPYLSPTAGLFFRYPDYVDFLSNLPSYLSRPILFREEQNQTDFISKQKHLDILKKYPIGIIEGTEIEIHFLHYKTKEEAINKWQRRAERINFDNLFIIGMDQNGCTASDIMLFDQLPFKNKIFFSAKDIKGDSIVFIKEFTEYNEVGNPHTKGHIFYKYMFKHLSQKSLIK